MKMTKKLLLAAVAAITVVGFTGCDFLAGKVSLSDAFQVKVDPQDILKYSDNSETSVWNVKGTNETEDKYVRALQFLTTKHSDMAGLVRLDSESKGVIGVLFNSSKVVDEKTKEVTYNFGIASVGKGDAKPYYYVSYFANIKEDDLGKENFGVGVNDKKDAVDSECKDPYEIVYKDLTTITDLTAISVEGEKGKGEDKVTTITYTVAIDVDENEDGSYVVNFYGKDTIGNNDTFKAEGKTAIGTVKMSAESLGKEKAKQSSVGCYAMINGKSHSIEGSLSILDLTNDAVIVE